MGTWRDGRATPHASDVTPEEWAYLAGIVDGEGTLRVESNPAKYRYPRITVTNTDMRLLAWLQNRFGGTLFEHQPAGYKIGKTTYLSTKATWRWDTAGKNGASIIANIFPHLIVKREKAEYIMRELPEKYPDFTGIIASLAGGA